MFTADWESNAWPYTYTELWQVYTDIAEVAWINGVNLTFIFSSQVEQLFYPFLVIAFCVSVVLLFVWIETSNEYHGFDW